MVQDHCTIMPPQFGNTLNKKETANTNSNNNKISSNNNINNTRYNNNSI